jgi:methyltransferase (TIGR00027 family)
VKAEEASRTAQFNALFRAMESARRPGHEGLFHDPLAPGFLGSLMWAYVISRVPLVGRLMPMYIDWKWPGVRPSAIGRTCWIDEQLCFSLKGGIRQVVILGAGYDCRAYRLPGMEGARVFEIDHPNTLAVKVSRLKDLLGVLPEHVTFVEADFDRQDFSLALRDSGFDCSLPTFFLWEGVMHYLTAEAVDVTLRSIASLSAPGSRLVFTYIHRGLLDGTESFGDMGHIPETLRESGETWTFGLRPEELKDYLAGRGFSLAADIGSIEYRIRYLGASGRHLKGFGFYRAALAEAVAHRDPDPVCPARYEERLKLKSGREVYLRPILETDGNLLVDLFNRISPRSLHQRFLTHLHTLPEDLLHHLTHLDYHREFALAGVAGEEGRDAIIAVCRYSLGRQGDLADLALAVRDDWQHLGLGKALLERIIAIAGQHGITRFGSMMDPGNVIMDKILKDLGYEVRYSLRGGFYEVEILV